MTALFSYSRILREGSTGIELQCMADVPGDIILTTEIYFSGQFFSFFTPTSMYLTILLIHSQTGPIFHLCMFHRDRKTTSNENRTSFTRLSDKVLYPCSVNISPMCGFYYLKSLNETLLKINNLAKHIGRVN